jgi:hypothetical protein
MKPATWLAPGTGFWLDGGLGGEKAGQLLHVLAGCVAIQVQAPYDEELCVVACVARCFVKGWKDFRVEGGHERRFAERRM